MRHAPLLFVTLLALIGCGDVQTTDPGFATPERTVATLLATHGPRRFRTTPRGIAERGSFQFRDAETWRLCFTDLETSGRGGHGWVRPRLPRAARDDLRYETAADRGYAILREGILAMERGDDGAYRIVLPTASRRKSSAACCRSKRTRSGAAPRPVPESRPSPTSRAGA
ncbi:MAG: hypothetical protein R3B82_17905 [Sandaracinaceae bacterium]